MDFEKELFEPRKDDWTDVATRRPTDAEDGSLDHYVIENERGSASETESRSERPNEDDVTENETRTQSRNTRDVSSPLGEKTNGTLNENDVTNDLQDAKMFQTEAQILPCPEYRKKKTLKKTLALEEGDITFDLTPTPTLLMNTDTSQKLELSVPFSFTISP